MKSINNFNQLTFVSILSGLLISFTLNAAVMKNTKSTNKTKNTQCEAMAKSIHNTRSAEQFKSILKKYGKNIVKSCEGYLKSDKKLERSLLNLSVKEGAAQKRKLLNTKKSNSRKVTPYKKLKANQPIEKLRAISKRKVQSLQNRRPLTKPKGRHTTAKISKVTPATIAPGLNIIIDGNGFGDRAGTVSVKISGKSFNATINAWQDNWINIYLPESISGVHETNNAVIVVKLNSNKIINVNIPFIPISEQRIVNGWFTEPIINLDLFAFAGHSGESTLFTNTVLKNGWTVKEWHFDEYTRPGECPKGAPFVNSGGKRLDSRIKWSHAWMGETIFCGIIVVIEGHKGFDADVEEFVRSY